jgi:hypothetical protein
MTPNSPLLSAFSAYRLARASLASHARYEMSGKTSLTSFSLDLIGRSL